LQARSSVGEAGMEPAGTGAAGTLQYGRQLAGLPKKPTFFREYQPPSMSQKQLEERTEWVYDEQTFPVWNASFEKSDRTEMIRDDLWAGRSISILLATLVAIGLILAGVTINFVVNWR